MSDNLKFLQHSEVTKLQSNIEKNLHCYTDKAETFASIVDKDTIKSIVTVTVDLDFVDKIKMPIEDGNNGDAYNSILIYNSIRVPPMYACDERIWVYLSHFDLRDYILQRWPMPSDNDKVKNHIRNHYFVHGSRGLSRDHGIARLWWMGYIASRSEKFENPQDALDILFLRSDVRANFLERSLSMNPDVFDAVVSLLQKDYETEKLNDVTKKTKGNAKKGEEKSTIFNRARFRDLMKTLNRIGGYRMLDVLGYPQLCKEIEEVSKISSPNGEGA